MSLQEDAWREGLRTKGRDWVLAELSMRPGMPDDPLHDVVHTPPYPTREFCQRWAVDVDNQFLSLSGSTKALICGMAILGILIAMAMHSWSEIAPGQTPTTPPPAVQE